MDQVKELQFVIQGYKRRADEWRGIASAMGYEPNAHKNVRPTAKWLVDRVEMFKNRLESERIQELLEANNRYLESNRALRAQLKKDRDQFEFYAEEHRFKRTPQADKKAEVNEQFVTDINNCLKANPAP